MYARMYVSLVVHVHVCMCGYVCIHVCMQMELHEHIHRLIVVSSTLRRLGRWVVNYYPGPR